MMIQASDQNGSTALSESSSAQFLDKLGNFIIAHSEKTDLVVLIVVIFVVWAIVRSISKKGMSLVGALRLIAGILSVTGGLVTAAVLLFLHQPDCSKISTENQMFAGFVALMAGLAMGGKELKASFSSSKSEPKDGDGDGD